MLPLLVDKNKQAKLKGGSPPPFGFTMIEILTVLVILGILISIAIPTYNSFTIRSRVTELLNVSSFPKASISEYRVLHGTMPDGSQIALPTMNTKFMSSLSVNAGQIIITGNQTTLGIDQPLSITLTPTFANGAVTWTCTSSGATQYVPSSCR